MVPANLRLSVVSTETWRPSSRYWLTFSRILAACFASCPDAHSDCVPKVKTRNTASRCFMVGPSARTFFDLPMPGNSPPVKRKSIAHQLQVKCLKALIPASGATPAKATLLAIMLLKIVQPGSALAHLFERIASHSTKERYAGNRPGVHPTAVQLR